MNTWSTLTKIDRPKEPSFILINNTMLGASDAQRNNALLINEIQRDAMILAEQQMYEDHARSQRGFISRLVDWCRI